MADQMERARIWLNSLGAKGLKGVQKLPLPGNSALLIFGRWAGTNCLLLGVRGTKPFTVRDFLEANRLEGEEAGRAPRRGGEVGHLIAIAVVVTVVMIIWLTGELVLTTFVTATITYFAFARGTTTGAVPSWFSLHARRLTPSFLAYLQLCQAQL